jgi:hypothetical protein
MNVLGIDMSGKYVYIGGFSLLINEKPVLSCSIWGV